jgi:prepilin-type N-terminal cleavage/methylation domain-containing protein
MKNRGFTFIEIMMVIGIMAILMLVSYPMFNKWQRNFQLNGAADEVANAIRLAQQLSITEQYPYSVKIYTSASNPILPEKSNTVKVSKWVSGTEVVVKRVTLDGCIIPLTEYSSDSVQFRTNGSCTGNGRIKILQNTSDHPEYRVISISGTTGKVSISDTWN